MTEAIAVEDPSTLPFWEAAARHELLIQRCATCGAHQFYPRPFCVRCQSSVTWVRATGDGTVVSLTTVRMEVLPELSPPYIVAIVELAEGPRLLTNVVHGRCGIGDRVRLAWRERPDAPPVPVFEPLGGGS